MNPTLMLINGPNLNMLGRRDPRFYGRFTLADVEKLTQDTAARYGFTVECFQSNHEGDLIDKIQDVAATATGLMINAGALTHYSYALRDALDLCDFPIIEVHISDIKKREAFRRVSVIEAVCSRQIAGHGLLSYKLAAECLCSMLREKEGGSDG